MNVIQLNQHKKKEETPEFDPALFEKAKKMVSELNEATRRLNDYIERSPKSLEEWEIQPEHLEAVAYLQLYDMAKEFLSHEPDDTSSFHLMVALELFRLANKNREELHPGSQACLPVVDYDE